MVDLSFDWQVRLAAFAWLRERTASSDQVLCREHLVEGFHFQGQRVPLLSPQGIFKPAILDLPLSIVTTPGSPYSDRFDGDFLTYSYRGTDPSHPDNVGLRRLMELRRPLVYFLGVVRGRYLAVWPTYVVADSPRDLVFTVAADDVSHLLTQPEQWQMEEGAVDRRRYVTASFRQRLHQSGFREQVLKAYRERCSMCRLRHRELLDAAHIVPDSDPFGEPVISNGLALCKLHHAAFDKHFLGIRPDYVVELRGDVLEEADGPMLRHGLQGLQGQVIWVPRRPELRPDPDRLEIRFNEFRRSA